MSQRRFTESHEWAELADDGIVTVGITDHAQNQLGDIVFVELPEIGREVEPGEVIAVVESVKAASDIYSPMAGEVIEINQAIVDAPDQVNASAEGDGWFFKLRAWDNEAHAKLLDRQAYEATLD